VISFLLASRSALLVIASQGLPILETRINALLRDVQEDLEALGTSPTPNNRSARGAGLLRLLSQFANNYGALLEGRQTPTRTLHGADSGPSRAFGSGNGSNIMDEPDVASELIGGARISYIFTGVYGESLNSVGSFDGLHDDEIRTVIANAHGTRPALFVPEVSFDILVRRQIARLEQPAKQCVDLVFGELQRIGKLAEPVELTRYPQLRDRLVAVTRRLLERSVQPTQMMVSHLVKIELAYINTSHPEFIGGSRAVARLMRQTAEQQRNQRRRSQFDDVSDDEYDRNEDHPVKRNDATDATEVGSPSMLFDKENGKQRRSKKDTGKEKDKLNTPLSPTTGPNKKGLNGPEPPADKPSGIMGLIFGSGSGEGPVNNSYRGGVADAPGMTKSHVADHSTESIVSGGGPPSVVHLPQIPAHVRQPAMAPLTERERVEMEIIKSLVDSYFGIVRRNMVDLVPKTIMYFLVNHVRDSLQNELVSELYRDADVGNLMQEAEDIASRRQGCQEMKELLMKALDIVNEVKVFHPPTAVVTK
jgi:dynamin 1-like protein